MYRVRVGLGRVEFVGSDGLERGKVEVEELGGGEYFGNGEEESKQQHHWSTI